MKEFKKGQILIRIKVDNGFNITYPAGEKWKSLNPFYSPEIITVERLKDGVIRNLLKKNFKPAVLSLRRLLENANKKNKR